MNVRRGVVAVVYRTKENNIEFLVLHRVFIWRGWELPKGGVEKTIDRGLDELAVKRELAEETGIKNIRLATKLPHTIRYKTPKKHEDKVAFKETVQSVFLIHALEHDVKLSMEHDSFMWLSYKDARKMLTHANQKRALDEAWDFMKKE